MSTNNCNFVEIYPDGSSRFKNDVCFARCDFNRLLGLRYWSKIEGGLSDEEVAFWIEFVRQMLTNDLPFTARSVDINGERYVEWELNKFSHNRMHNLIYTTAFRYTDEFFMVVRALYKASKTIDNFPELFEEFHQIHIDMIFGTGKYADLHRYKVVLNHCLIDCVTGDSSEFPVGFDHFRENLQAETKGVQLHFA